MSRSIVFCIGRKDEFNACDQPALYCQGHAERLGNAELMAENAALAARVAELEELLRSLELEDE